MPRRGTDLAARSPGLGCRALLRSLPQPLHRRVLEVCLPDQHRAAEGGHGDGGCRGQRSADLHLPGATAGVRPDRLRGRILGAGPGGGGGAHTLLLAAAGRRHPRFAGRTVGHQRQDQRPAGRLLSRALVRLSAAGLDEPVDGPGLRDAGVLRHPLHHRGGPALGGR